MERRFELRKEALIAEAQVDEQAFRGVVERLGKFVEPFAVRLARREQVQHALDFVAGLVSDVDRKNTESIAYRHDQERKELQHFIGQSNWDHQPLILELAGQVGHELGCSDAVLVFDPSGFPKKGTESVGVQRQWCGRLGKVDNCQVGIYMGYASDTEHALVNMRLYLPQDWATDSQRRKKCHVPRTIRFPHGTNCVWRCSKKPDTCCRTPGSRETMKSGEAAVFAGNCGAAESTTCWPCRPIR